MLNSRVIFTISNIITIIQNLFTWSRLTSNNNDDDQNTLFVQLSNVMITWAISKLPCASVSKRVFAQHISFENEFDLHENELISGTYCKSPYSTSFYALFWFGLILKVASSSRSLKLSHVSIQNACCTTHLLCNSI